MSVKFKSFECVVLTCTISPQIQQPNMPPPMAAPSPGVQHEKHDKQSQDKSKEAGTQEKPVDETVNKSTLNPMAKEFTLNPDAKVFMPKAKNKSRFVISFFNALLKSHRFFSVENLRKLS